MNVVLELKNISKYINSQEYIIRDINIAAHQGEIIALVGPSGSGKSTILQIAGLLDTPSAGEVFFNGKNVSALKDKQRTHIRRQYLGFVYQFHHLLPELSIKQNIALPQLVAGKVDNTAVEEIITKLSIQHIMRNNVSTLSGGEKQRVAIARALIHKPHIILADEPTGNLDHKNSTEVLNLFIKMARENNTTIIMVTHDNNLVKKVDRVLYLQSGSLVS